MVTIKHKTNLQNIDRSTEIKYFFILVLSVLQDQHCNFFVQYFVQWAMAQERRSMGAK